MFGCDEMTSEIIIFDEEREENGCDSPHKFEAKGECHIADFPHPPT